MTSFKQQLNLKSKHDCNFVVHLKFKMRVKLPVEAENAND